ncbi:response regulator transcription factor [Leptolyngbya sp. AN02str]|uniref:response regulator transcription factor n=1 Tax=Leptolyngbya sp. AN02str TaxID=3423363 RepID=UPI003D311A59
MPTILVIEDEQQTRDIFLRCLAFEGFDALGAASGSEGIAMAIAQPPDLVVCDIMMPDLDGYQVLSTLRQETMTAAIPFIFLTAKVTMMDLRRGMELGADDYLTKPCTVEQFLTAISTRLQRQTMLKHWYTEQNARDIASTDSIFPDIPKLAPVFQFIECYYQQSITLSDVAQAAGYSPAYLTNVAQDLTGRSIKQWITERRMTQARMLLQQTDQPIGEVAAASGYADVSYFIRLFRQHHGMSPQVWRTSLSTSLHAKAG